LEVVAIDELSLDSDIIAVTQAPERVNVGWPGIVGKRDSHPGAISLPNLENATLMVNSFHGPFEELRPWRGRNTSRDRGTRTGLYRLLYPDRINVVAAAATIVERNEIAGLKFANVVLTAMIEDAGRPGIVFQNARPIVVGADLDFVPGRLNLNDLTADLTGLQSRVSDQTSLPETRFAQSGSGHRRTRV
jgi:hypothetical protein